MRPLAPVLSHREGAGRRKGSEKRKVNSKETLVRRPKGKPI